MDIETLFNRKFSEESKNMRIHFNNLRMENKFCDLTLKTKDGALFEVHKIIMYSVSGFFQGLYDSSWLETKDNIIELDENVPSEVLIFILQYIYTGSIETSKISCDVALKMYTAATFLNMSIFRSLIEEYLIKTLSLNNSLVLWRHNEILLSEHINDKTIEFIKNNCNEFLDYNMLELKGEEIKIILSFNDLEWSQQHLLSNILQWIKIDFDERQIFIKDFFGQIKFKEISSHYIVEKIIEDEILFKNNFVPKFVAKEMGSRSKNSNDISYFAKSETNKPLLITKYEVYKIDTTEKKVVQLLSWKKQKKAGFSVTKCNGNDLFFTGPKKKCEFYGKYEFYQLPSMLEEKQCHSSLNFENKVYCCGGINSQTMETFDLYVMKWLPGSLMNHGRSSFGLIDYDDSIYAIGGEGRNGLSTLVEKYDPRIDKWINVPVIENVSITKSTKQTAIGSLGETDKYSKAVIHKNRIFASDYDCINQFKLNHNGLEVVKTYELSYFGRLPRFIPFTSQEDLYVYSFSFFDGREHNLDWMKLNESTDKFDLIAMTEEEEETEEEETSETEQEECDSIHIL